MFSVCYHPEILLPWQCDVTTFPLYKTFYSTASNSVVRKCCDWVCFRWETWALRYSHFDWHVSTLSLSKIILSTLCDQTILKIMAFLRPQARFQSLSFYSPSTNNPASYTDEIYRRRNFYFALWKEEVLENLFMCMMCFTVGQLIPFAVKPVRCLHSTSCILTCLFRTGNHVQFNFNFLYNFQLTGILCSLSANTLCVTVLKQFLYRRMLLLTIQGISLNSRY